MEWTRRKPTRAKLGDLKGALADAALLAEDHWMPGHSDLPGGNKAEFIEEIKRRAAAAKSGRR